MPNKKPAGLQTKIFLDSGNPLETESVIKDLGFLDGQTTNPSLVVKNPDIQKYISEGKKFGEAELFAEYKNIVKAISNLIPEGSVSIEVYADEFSSSDDLLAQAEQMNSWIPNAHIKFPTIKSGLEAAEKFTQQGGRVNMTLVFSEDQAVAVHMATIAIAQKGDAFISPFIGRLDDKGLNGLDLIKNIDRSYQSQDSKVEVLAASIRGLEHFLGCIELGTDIITTPKKVIDMWLETGLEIPKNFNYPSGDLEPIDYKMVEFGKSWKDYNYKHDLTTSGLDKFAKDWNDLLS